jgi:polygalacturonase
MEKQHLTRREAVGLGAKVAGVAALGSTLLPAPVRAQKSGPRPRDFNVRDYGAAGDGIALDTASIQRAIDEAAAAGAGARVLVPGGYRYLVGTLQLRGGIDFHLADDAELIVSSNREHYASGAVMAARGAHGLRISGTGNINGRAREFLAHFDQAKEWWQPKRFRPKIFVLTSCRDLEVRDISFSEAPSWGLHMLGCEGVLVDNLTVRNLLDVPNCDGIDPDHCRDVEIRNCHITYGDDAIVVKTSRQAEDYGPSANISVHDCVLETQSAGVKIGTETTQDIYDIRFERCEIKSSSRGLSIQLRDEGNVYNVEFRDIKFVSRYHSDPWWGKGEAISLTAIPRTIQTNLGNIHDVRIQNVNGRAENSVRINGTVENRIRNVSLENVHVTLDRFTKYPGGVFDDRPTSVYRDMDPRGNPGFSIRYADHVTLKDCGVNWGENLPHYFTHALEAEYVSGLELTNFAGKAAHLDRDADIWIR